MRQYFLNKTNMGKICKYSNLYDKNGNFLHKPGNYTIEEIEKLVDKLAEDSPQSKEYSNAIATLMHMYEIKGNPHKDEIIQKLNDCAKSKTTKSEVINALNEMNDETGTPNPGEEKEVRRAAGGSSEESRRERSSNTDYDTGITA